MRNDLQLTAAAKAERQKDRQGLPQTDPGIDQVLDEGAAWLARAQDCSATADGGVARHYSLLSGWGSSYPETTGYIIPTMLDYARYRPDEDARERARRMLDWLVSIQLPGGGFQGGMVDAHPVVPVTFNTGQILIGLAAGLAEFGDYREALIEAADWLVRTQDSDGCWRAHPSPFAEPGEKVYETHVSWGLFEAERLAPGRGYGEAGLRQVHWALTHQRENGWFDNCCLINPQVPLTHTLGYALRGILEAYRLDSQAELLAAARTTADGLRSALREDGFLSARLTEDWQPARPWACLTGTVQVAHCWLMLYRITGEVKYREAGYLANRYVRQTVAMSGPPEQRGGVKGSFPVEGGYGRYEYLNWAVKFSMDANQLERTIRARE